MVNLYDWALALIQGNTLIAYGFLAVVCFGESLAFVSLLLPGTTLMVAAGALVSQGKLDWWPVVIAGMIGATLGDAVSYWIGLRFKHTVPRLWPFTRHPDWLDRGHAFFNRHGGKSVFIGRFFGPVRAVIPLAAGMMEMPWGNFWIANIGSAILWAPGVVFSGAAMGWLFSQLELDNPWVQAALWIGAGTLLALYFYLRRNRTA